MNSGAMERRDLKYHLGLTMITVAVMALPAGGGNFFGSGGDWYSQHVGAAEALRQTIADSGVIFPQLVNIGGGSNIYDLAYYGLFRPDVMISCLFPGVEMKYFIAVYAAMGFIASVNMMYIWLRGKEIRRSACLMGGLFMAGAACFFHAHHHVMFVSYMPFLILALMGADRLLRKGRMGMAVSAVFLIMIHSFFYVPACLLVCLIYFLHEISHEDKERREKLREFVKGVAAVLLGLGMSGVLLIPSALAIVSTGKDGGSFAAAPAEIFDFSMKGLLYNPYGCGLTLISLYGLIASLFMKRKRMIAAAILAIFTIPVIWLALSGFLYPRSKMLIPFVPLIIWLCVDTLEEKAPLPGTLLICLISLVPAVFSRWTPVILIDAVLMTIFLLSKAAARIPAVVGRCAMIAVMTFSLLVSIGVSRVGEEYLPLSDTRQDGFPFDSQQIRLISDGMYRFDYLVESLVNSNFLPAGDVKKTAMYSSVSNSLYSEFFYDIMKNPISYRNRVILTPGSNVFFNYFMGVRHVVAEEGKVPAGYREIFRHGNFVLAENKNVLPVCYGNYGSPSPTPVKTERQAAESFFTGGFPHDIDFVKARELSVKLTEPMEDKAIILSFRVDRDDGNQSVIIDINGMRNKLAPDSAPYPNENYVFTYVLSSDSAIDALKCRFSAGKYRLRDITVKTAELPSVQNEAMAEAKESPEYRFDGHTVFKGSIDMEKDGYFVTSWPYKEGYEIRVEGKKAEAEKINRAFLGFPLERGHHMVDIKYTAPGFTAGAAASVISFGIALTGTFYGRWRRR